MVNAAVGPSFHLVHRLFLTSHFYSLLRSIMLCEEYNFYCRKGIQLAHVGNCTSLDENEFCPDSCPEDEDTPVCGSDGN